MEKTRKSMTVFTLFLLYREIENRWGEQKNEGDRIRSFFP